MRLRAVGGGDFFKNLERFLVTSTTLVVLGDFNTDVDERIDYVGSADRK